MLWECTTRKMATMKRLQVLWVLTTLVLGIWAQVENTRLVYNITEEQEPYIFVGSTAVDSQLFSSTSSSDFQLLRFDMFYSGNTKARFFVVDEQSGVIRTNATIDREAICGNEVDCSIILNLAVYRKTSQDASFAMFRTIEVVVRIEDKNDNAPQFPQKVVTLPIAENRPAPYRLRTSVASDADKKGENSQLMYSLEDSSGIFTLEVDNAGSGLTDLVIVVNQMLDREKTDSYYITIVASDRGQPRMSGSVLINVAVTDVNDNQPVFSQSNYTVNLLENASVRDPILTLSAVDKDSNDNGRVVYRLGSRVGQEITQFFQVGEADGKIYLTKPVDYEQETQFVFLVEAADRGNPPQSAFAYVTVNIVDVNDNAPQISLNLSPAGTDIVEHDPPGKFLGHITVTDLDSGSLGAVLCELDDPNFQLEEFGVNVYKIVLAHSLDREDLPRRQVNIRCRDGDKNPLIATATFEVRVVDINDNAPVFSHPTFSGTVLENEQAGANVLQMYSEIITPGDDNVLRVVADDLDDGDNGRVTYSILPDTNFSIDSLTGTLSALVSFDREAQASYELQVFAKDHGTPPKTSTATVVITILDQNDHPPHFAQPIFYLQIEENLAPGSLSGHVTAIDEDVGANAKLVYNIVRDADSSRYFSVDRDSGVVTSNQMFDRETRDSYTFTVEVENPSIPSYRDSAQVMVAVLDANDHAPRITNPTPSNNSITLPNNTTVGSMVIKVRAEDADDPDSTVFEFRMISDGDDNLFQIIKVTGELILAREIHPQDAKQHTLTLVVSDGGSRPKTATASLVITIPAEGLRSAASANLLSETNFIIIVIIVAVTIFAALLIVTTICCIFRRDRKKRGGRTQHRQVKDKMYQAAHWVSTHSLPLGDAGGTSSGPDAARGTDSNGERKGKKEVSFSLDEDMEKEGDPDTSGSLGSVFSSNNADNNNLLKPPSDGRFMFIGGKTSPGTNSTSCYESSDSNNVYQNTPIAEAEDHLHMQIERHGEDALSASSGETGTDSGRGGSEDEAHSNRGSSLETDSRSYHPHAHAAQSPSSSSSSGFSSFTGGDRGRRKPSSLSSLPEEHHRHHNDGTNGDMPLHPNHNYFRSSSEQLPAHGLGYPAGCSRNYQSDRDNYYSMERAGDGPFRIRDAPNARRTFHTFGPQYTQHPHPNSHQHPHPAWQRAKGLDGDWRSVTPTTSYATDDDDLTTTSGSYTLSPDDPPTDGDDLSFHHVHDIMV